MPVGGTSSVGSHVTAGRVMAEAPAGESDVPFSG